MFSTSNPFILLLNNWNFMIVYLDLFDQGSNRFNIDCFNFFKLCLESEKCHEKKYIKEIREKNENKK